MITTAVLFLLHIYLLYFPNFFGSVNQCRVEKKIRKDLIKKYLSMSNYEYIKFDKSFLLNVFLSDTFNVAATLINYKVAKIMAGFQFAIFFIIVFYIDFKLASVSLIFVPLYFLALLLSRKNLHKLSAAREEKYDEYVATTNATINGKTQINLNNAESFFTQKTDKGMDNYFSARLKSEFVYVLLNRIPVFIQALEPIIILTIGSNLVRKNMMTIGTLVMFVQYVGMMFEPIGHFAQLLTQKNTNRPAFDRLSQILFNEFHEKSLPETTLANDGQKSQITNTDIYTNDNKLLFQVDKLSFNKTGIYCIKGENGSGKTTFINLLCLIYDPDCFKKRSKDSIFQITKNFDSKSYLHHPHFLFDGTVRENILLGKNVDESRLQEFCRALNFYDFLEKEVKTNPTNLSDGEQQKLCLIRTLLLGSHTIILDEPEKSLDKESIRNLHQILLTLKDKHLIIIISHTNTFDKEATAIWKIADKKLEVIE